MIQNPRAHVPKLIQTKHVLARVHGAGAMGRFNAAIAVRITRIVGTNFLQLVLLPIIIVGQNVISAAQDARAEADHETLTALHMMSRQQLTILEGQTEILDLLKQR